MVKRAFLVLSVFPCLLLGAQSGDDPGALAKKELEPRLFTLANGERPLSEILSLLHKQTGNLVVDRRRAKTDLKIDLGLEKVSFWQALDAIAMKCGCGVSPYQADGQVALVDGRRKSAPTSHSGIFRVAARRLSLAREDEESHVGTLNLEVAWEPRFEPFYLDVGNIEVVYSPLPNQKPQVEKVASRGQLAVSGRTAADVELRFPAPPRQVQKIQSVKGVLKVVGPSKMLDFTFDKLQPIKKADERRAETRQGVKLTLTGLKIGADRWTVDILIENPPGGPVFESFQSWLDNNRIALVRDKKTWVPEADAEEQLETLTATRAHIRYYFTGKADAAGWTLRYRTPGRIVEVTAPFLLEDLPLP